MSEPISTHQSNPQDDLLWQQLKDIPAFRAVLRAVESRFYHQLDIVEPVLDLGCGDGHFAEVTFNRSINAGLDPWWGPLQKSRRLGLYDSLVQGLGHEMPYPSNYFATVYSNSVLEHIPDLQPVLNETNRIMQEDGRLVFTTVSNYYTEFLRGGEILNRLGMPRAAAAYQRFFNKIARHAHTDTPEEWATRLARAGFEIERWQYYYSRDALHALEWGHIQGLPSAILHAITGWWIVAPWRSNLSLTERWVRPFYDEEAPEKGACILFVVRKRGSVPAADEPVSVRLPAPQPYSIAELSSPPAQTAPALTNESIPEPEEAPVYVAQFEQAAEVEMDAMDVAEVEEPAGSTFSKRLINSILLIITLLSATSAQLSMARNADSASSGLTLYAIAVVGMLILSFRVRHETIAQFTLPRLGTIPWQRWFIFPAFLLSLLAAGRSSNAVALIVWFLAIGLALFALWPRSFVTDSAAAPAIGDNLTWRRFRLDLLISIGFFAAAFLLRAINLSGIPWMLTGSEANIGLDAVALIEGRIASPFSTGWISNPIMPLYLIAIPIRLFGQSVFAIRIMSALFGALTVAATYLIGKRIWNRSIGMVAGILLLGSSFHLHYSRLGLTNVWDGLIALLGLGLLMIAWQRNRPVAWLAAGVTFGLSAYLYTASHLMPLMLLSILLLQLFFDRERLWQRLRGLAMMLTMALIVALPQIQFYNGAPGIFMERANALGIYQTGWIQGEAAQRGVSELTVFGEQFLRAALAFNYEWDLSPVYNPTSPLLRFWPAIFFVFGLGIAVSRLSQIRNSVLVSWWLITVVFAGALLQITPSSHRLIIAAPAVTLFAAPALVWIGERILGAFDSLRPHRLRVLLGFAILVTALDVVYYFNNYPTHNRFGDRNTEIAYEVTNYLNELEGENTVYFYGPPSIYSDFPTIPFLAPAYQRNINIHDVADSLVGVPPPLTERVVFIFLPERFDALEEIGASYSNGTVDEVNGIYGTPLFYTYEAFR